MSTDMQIKVSQMEGRVPVTVFHISGKIDASTHNDLQSRASDAHGAGANHLLLDLSDVDYMASAGFRAIHSINQMLQGDSEGDASNPPLKLLNPSDEVSRIIKTLGFDHYVSTHTDLKDAIASF